MRSVASMDCRFGYYSTRTEKEKGQDAPPNSFFIVFDVFHIVLGKLVISGSSAYLEDAFVVDDSMVETQTFDDETVQNAIDNYSPNNAGKIDWEKGSCPFFIDNRLYFEELTADTFLSEIEGEWLGKEYVSVATKIRQIVFTSDSTADVCEIGDKVYEWKYTSQ